MPKKDPNRPKRPTTAFFAFTNEIRASVRQEFPEASLGNVSQIIGERWRKLTDSQKQPYVEIAAQDKVRYEREMSTYVPPPMEEEPSKTKRKKKDPNAPKRAMSAFFWYAKDVRPSVREQNPTSSMGQISQIIGDMWRGLSAEQKAPYEASAEDDKERYKREMEAYRGN